MDLEQFIDTLEPSETRELSGVYVGMYEKLSISVIIHRLTEQQLRNCGKEVEKKEKKKSRTYKEKSKRISAINFYCTNIPAEYVPTSRIHDFYSLRWQIEIFWKSLFSIRGTVRKMRIYNAKHIFGTIPPFLTIFPAAR
ncbi:hypothetical protein CKF96_03110 (plasmid) [Priestia filamentosa]|nr:hypothetical protein CKF96_03110 [Priestia filamentosa]